ncbi:hypothetical protein [Maribellus sediminis]|uniref:hypothetical protein n=1 Tax=Maribellus sediminis TaxID=2696285 RepID=UPI001431984D|nr:hypothetical protein [Maribellus sediminis]
MRFHQILTLVAVSQALFFGVLFYKYLNKALKVVFAFVSMAVISEFSAQIIIHLFKGTTIWKTHFYVMFEFFFWALFFWYLMKPFVNKNLYWLVVTVFEIYCIVNIIFIQGLNEYPTTRAIESILMIVLSILTFYRIMVEGKIDKLRNEPVIWINSAVLLYFASSIFFHLVFNVLLVKDVEFLKKSGYLFIAVNVAFYALLSISFYLQKVKAPEAQKPR